MSANTGGSAFPEVSRFMTDKDECCWSYEQGMTLRDYFAAKAMAALFSNSESRNKGTDWISIHAYIAADSMIAQRAK